MHPSSGYSARHHARPQRRRTVSAVVLAVLGAYVLSVVIGSTKHQWEKFLWGESTARRGGLDTLGRSVMFNLSLPGTGSSGGGGGGGEAAAGPSSEKDGSGSGGDTSRPPSAAADRGRAVVRAFHAGVAAVRALNASAAGFAGVPGATCPPALRALGVRPPVATPARAGTACEPWFGRGALELLAALLTPDMAALEWGSGASTAWLLSGRVRSLATVEHDARRGRALGAALTAALGKRYLEGRWALHAALPAAPLLTFLQSESAEHFLADYVAAPFAPALGLDLLVVGGVARAGCLHRALRLLRPAGGVLVLGSSQRGAYAAALAAVPPHWLRFDDASVLGRTTVWVSCSPGRCG